jgi:integrase
VYSFLEINTHFSVTTKEHYQYILRDFFKYLYKENLCGMELINLFPIISLHSKNSYPSYFSAEAISKVLNSIDTNCCIGKRDYLILLLASQLGLRVSDICSITLDNIDFSSRTLNFIQTKTREFLTLPLADELLYALIDYIKNARPSCDFQEIIITSRAPYKPCNTAFYEMLQKYFQLADIQISDDQKHGLHSFRSSLASDMLKNGTSMPVIANVLGHKYRETTRSYIKIDIDGLRKAALEVPYDCD